MEVVDLEMRIILRYKYQRTSNVWPTKPLNTKVSLQFPRHEPTGGFVLAPIPPHVTHPTEDMN